jgi:predicted DNA-binding protein (MmcQ/YjbR family)
MKKKLSAAEVHKAMLKAALAYPGAWEDHPWGETVVKVAKKIFVFVGSTGGELGLSLKLPETGEAALATFPFTSPTGYGLGKAGWVSCRFEKGAELPLPLLLEWMDESYRAVAPKKLLKARETPEAPARAAPTARAKRKPR